MLKDFEGLFDLDGKTKRRTFPRSYKEEMFKTQGRKCMYCGKRQELAYMHLDHKTPLAKGGKNTEGNLHIICAPCNTRKGTMTDGEYRRKYKLVGSRQAKKPPTKIIPQKYFEDISKSSQAKKAKIRRKKDDDLFSLRW